MNSDTVVLTAGIGALLIGAGMLYLNRPRPVTTFQPVGQPSGVVTVGA